MKLEHMNPDPSPPKPVRSLSVVPTTLLSFSRVPAIDNQRFKNHLEDVKSDLSSSSRSFLKGVSQGQSCYRALFETQSNLSGLDIFETHSSALWVPLAPLYHRVSSGLPPAQGPICPQTCLLPNRHSLSCDACEGQTGQLHGT